MILIITNKIDQHADAVIEHLHKKKAPFVRFNTEDFPQKISVDWQLDKKNNDGLMRLYGIHQVKFSEMTACWYRRPEAPKLSSHLKTAPVREYARKESQEFLKSLWAYFSDRFWIGHPFYIHNAEHKMTNLKLAASIGLNVPDTIITTVPNEALNFFQKHNGNIVTKTLDAIDIESKEELYFIYTHKLSLSDKDRLDSVAYVPTQLQEYISKKVEIRVTVVGDKVFSCEIHSQASEKTKHDWRHYDFDNVKHLSHQLPQSVEKKLLQMLDSLHLYYGAFDLILTPEGDYVFLELNPNGQYQWIEALAGLPISKSIADLLIRGKV